MSRITSWSYVGLASLALAGCNKAGEPSRDVAYYEAHDAERASKVAECRNNPGALAGTANCINAAKADDNRILSKRNSRMPVIR